MKTFDAYAHNPYYGVADRDADHEAAADEAARRRRRSRSGTSTTCSRRADAALRAAASLDHRVRLPDEPARHAFGVSWANQARYLTQAFAIARKNPRIDMMLWFLLKDEPDLVRLAVRARSRWTARRSRRSRRYERVPQ